MIKILFICHGNICRSVSAEYMHAWWKSDRSHRYWRTYGGNVELRYWFGRKAQEKRLTGHHVGAYFGALTYDFEWGGKGYLARDASTNFGLSYGYALPIARRLNLDFEIGIGYFSGKYDEYEGNGHLINENGDYYIGQFLKGQINGKGIYFRKNGTIEYEGDLVNGKYEGIGKFYFENDFY